MSRVAALAIALAAIIATGASAKPVAPGIYGNVTYIEEAGDLVGMELELIGSGDQSRVEFVSCEGDCRSLIRAPVHLTNDGFDFSYLEKQNLCVDGECRPASPVRTDARARMVGNSLRIRLARSDDSAGTFSATLKKLKKRYGLAVAEVW